MRAARLARVLRRQVGAAPAVVRERERDRRARERDARERLVAAREFRGLALQELAARGRVEVEVLDFHRGARGERGRLHAPRPRRPRTRCATHDGLPRAGSRWRAARPRRWRRAPRRGSPAWKRAPGPARVAILLVAKRATASGRSSRSMPEPSSATRSRRTPPSDSSTAIDWAPASRLFSSSSLRAEAGRSTTSPAAIWFTNSSGRGRIWATGNVTLAPRTYGSHRHAAKGAEWRPRRSPAAAPASADAATAADGTAVRGADPAALPVLARRLPRDAAGDLHPGRDPVGGPRASGPLRLVRLHLARVRRPLPALQGLHPPCPARGGDARSGSSASCWAPCSRACAGWRSAPCCCRTRRASCSACPW